MLIGPIGQESSHTSRKGTAANKRHNTVEVADGELNIGWTIAYYVLLVAGAVAFGKNLWVLTESSGKLADV